MMRSLEELLRENNLKDPEDIGVLLELAEITGSLIRDEQYGGLEKLIACTVGSGCYKAFTWVIAALQEEYEKGENCRLKDFTCFIGTSIPACDEFIGRLQADLRAVGNDAETIADRNGEVQSFFNILTYRTAYANIFLVTEENFDTRDNDFIRYKLRFTSNP